MSKFDKIIIGTEQLGGADWGKYNISHTESAIKYGLDIGVRSFDTAHVYGLGLSEKRLSKLMGGLRHECEIITKIGLTWDDKSSSNRATVNKDLSYKSMLSDVQGSLKNLDIDQIPVLLAHWPDNHHSTEEVVENLYRLKEEGLINKIGLSNFNIEEILNIQNSIPIDFYQGSLSLLDFSKLELYKNMSEQGIDIMTYGPLHHGMLTGKYDVKSTFPKSDRRHRLSDFTGEKGRENYTKVDIVSRYAKMLECDIKAISIKMLYTLGVKTRIVIGVKNESQIRENLNSLDLYIPNSVASSLLTELSKFNCNPPKN
jgi:aryl-alcohol dehydrogenase-like predicted oxidoreductase